MIILLWGERMGNVSAFWKTNLKVIDDTLKGLKEGRVQELGKSAGKRSIWLVRYGSGKQKKGQANYCSALAAENAKYYNGGKTMPVLLLVAGEHGGEMEGIAALMNLINILETGFDLRGRAWERIRNFAKEIDILLIPCLNPDGRSRVPFDCMAGKSLREMRYYMQGTWKDGSLCGWPDCKKVHPVLHAVEHLGAYYNDDGVNIMVDNVFTPMARETEMLLRLTGEEMPSLTLHLHGGDNCHCMLMPPLYVTNEAKRQAQCLDRNIADCFRRNGLPYYEFDKTGNDEMETPMPFSVEHAIFHVCGGLSLVFESNMGLSEPETTQYSMDEILDAHLLLFEEALKMLTEEMQEGKR